MKGETAMRSVLSLAVLLLAGAWCPASAQTYWDKPGNQPGEFERDKAECLAIWGQEGRRAMQAWEFDGCLVARGWQVVRQGPVQIPMMPSPPLIYAPPPGVREPRD